jgi:hypothetical protein
MEEEEKLLREEDCGDEDDAEYDSLSSSDSWSSGKNVRVIVV